MRLAAHAGLVRDVDRELAAQRAVGGPDLGVFTGARAARRARHHHDGERGEYGSRGT